MSLRAAEHFFAARRPELAERELRGWLALHPGNVNGHAMLAWSLALQKRRAEAIAEVGEALRLAPDWAYTRTVAAEVYFQLGKMKHAERMLRSALEIDPEDPGKHALLASALLSQPFRWRAGRHAFARG